MGRTRLSWPAGPAPCGGCRVWLWVRCQWPPSERDQPSHPLRRVGWPQFYPRGTRGWRVRCRPNTGALCCSPGRAGASLSGSFPVVPCHSLGAALRELCRPRRRRAGSADRLRDPDGAERAERQPGLGNRRQRQRGSSGSWHRLPAGVHRVLLHTRQHIPWGSGQHRWSWPKTDWSVISWSLTGAIWQLVTWEERLISIGQTYRK